MYDSIKIVLSEKDLNNEISSWKRFLAELL